MTVLESRLLRPRARLRPIRLPRRSLLRPRRQLALFRARAFRAVAFRLPAFRLPAFRLPAFRLPEFRPYAFQAPGFRVAAFRAPGLPGPAPALLRPAPEVKAPRRPAGARRPAWSMLAAATACWALGALALYALFLHMSRTVAVNSDGASNALQAWAMLHGNPLLRGWQLSDVSFYTTELPQYMVIELARGLTPGVVHVAAASTYTLVVVLAARLAKGRATGAQGLLRASIAVGIMIAPQHAEVTVLMLSPDHVGSTVPVMATWLLIDHARRRWYVPVASFLLLAWALVADQVVLLTGVAPIVLVGLAGAYQKVVRDRERATAAIFELALAAAGLAAAEAGWRVLALISRSGGFLVWPVGNRLIGPAGLGPNLLRTCHSVLLLFGADFLGQRAGVAVAIDMVHLAGLGLAAWAVCAALRRLPGCDLAVRLLAVGTLVSLACYALGPNAHQPLSSREFAAVLPFGAALAGRQLAARLSQARLVPALGAVLVVYATGAAQVAARPAAPAQNQALATWLAAHKLSYGLAEYWIANSVTLDSGGSVQVRSIKRTDHLVRADWWEIQRSWYDPAAHAADYVVLPSNGIGPPPGPGINPPTLPSVLASFGQPARIYLLPGYTVLVWSKNLLTELR
jgi:hypothetical protein